MDESKVKRMTVRAVEVFDRLTSSLSGHRRKDLTNPYLTLMIMRNNMHLFNSNPPMLEYFIIKINGRKRNAYKHEMQADGDSDAALELRYCEAWHFWKAQMMEKYESSSFQKRKNIIHKTTWLIRHQSVVASFIWIKYS